MQANNIQIRYAHPWLTFLLETFKGTIQTSVDSADTWDVAPLESELSVGRELLRWNFDYLICTLDYFVARHLLSYYLFQNFDASYHNWFALVDTLIMSCCCTDWLCNLL